MIKTASPMATKPTQQEIAARARAIYEESGRLPGRDLQNWLQAEDQLIAQHQQGSVRENSAEKTSTHAAKMPPGKTASATRKHS
jgi:hypothetical protein